MSCLRDSRMPGASTEYPETYLCTSVPVPEEMGDNFVVGFE